MAVSCAKPGCSHHAVAWFTLARSECIVRMHDTPVEGAIALCAAHRARFTTPSGWAIEDVATVVPLRRDPESQPAEPRRVHRPWFADEPAVDAPVAIAGGLLGRAFNGPSRLT